MSTPVGERPISTSLDNTAQVVNRTTQGADKTTEGPALAAVGHDQAAHTISRDAHLSTPDEEHFKEIAKNLVGNSSEGGGLNRAESAKRNRKCSILPKDKTENLGSETLHTEGANNEKIAQNNHAFVRTNAPIRKRTLAESQLMQSRRTGAKLEDPVSHLKGINNQFQNSTTVEKGFLIDLASKWVKTPSNASNLSDNAVQEQLQDLIAAGHDESPEIQDLCNNLNDDFQRALASSAKRETKNNTNSENITNSANNTNNVLPEEKKATGSLSSQIKDTHNQLNELKKNDPTNKEAISQLEKKLTDLGAAVREQKVGEARKAQSEEIKQFKNTIDTATQEKKTVVLNKETNLLEVKQSSTSLKSLVSKDKQSYETADFILNKLMKLDSQATVNKADVVKSMKNNPSLNDAIKNNPDLKAKMETIEKEVASATPSTPKSVDILKEINDKITHQRPSTSELDKLLNKKPKTNPYANDPDPKMPLRFEALLLNNEYKAAKKNDVKMALAKEIIDKCIKDPSFNLDEAKKNEALSKFEKGELPDFAFMEGNFKAKLVEKSVLTKEDVKALVQDEKALGHLENYCKKHYLDDQIAPLIEIEAYKNSFVNGKGNEKLGQEFINNHILNPQTFIRPGQRRQFEAKNGAQIEFNKELFDVVEDQFLHHLQTAIQERISQGSPLV